MEYKYISFWKKNTVLTWERVSIIVRMLDSRIVLSYVRFRLRKIQVT